MAKLALISAALLCLWLAWQVAAGYHKAQMTAAFMAGMEYERMTLNQPVADNALWCAAENARAGRMSKKNARK